MFYMLSFSGTCPIFVAGTKRKISLLHSKVSIEGVMICDTCASDHVVRPSPSDLAYYR